MLTAEERTARIAKIPVEFMEGLIAKVGPVVEEYARSSPLKDELLNILIDEGIEMQLMKCLAFIDAVPIYGTAEQIAAVASYRERLKAELKK